LKSTRKERIGWYFYDWANSAFITTVVTVFMGPYLTSIAKSAADVNGNILVMGIPVYSGSFFAYVVSLSVILQVVILPVFGALADRFNLKKHLLLSFAYIGSLTTISMFCIQGSNYLQGGILFLVSNFCFGCSIVMYNSYLGDLADKSETDSVSSIGWAVGYIGGGILLAFNLVLFKNAELLKISTEMAVRISLSSAGAWWALFTLIPAFTLRVHKNKHAAIVQNKSRKISDNPVIESIKKLIKTFKDARHYPATILFLTAYLFYNDGVQAVITISSQFGQQELNLSMGTLTQIILMVQFVAFGGSLLFNFIAKKISTIGTIKISLFIWLILTIYAYAILKTELDFWLMAFVTALVLGGTQALSRSMFSRLIPPGSEAEYFSIYEVSERGTSWIGPFLFGFSLQLTHSYRIAILSLGVFFIIGIVILFKRKNNLSTI